jgi:predicted glycosyltransferase
LLPGLGKQADGRYRPRALHVSLTELIHLRASTIRGALESFAPDLLIVDKIPLGAFGELQPGLESLRCRYHTRCVLGLRDVLDDPVTVRREWHEMQGDLAVRRYYDAIWVYGDPAVYDPVQEYGLSREVASKVRYTGYLDRCGATHAPGANDSGLQTLVDAAASRLALCLVGGGQDGFQLADSFARAELPPGTSGVIVGGPYMPPSALRSLYRRAAREPHMQVLRFVARPEPLIKGASAIVAMGGYNTVCEVLSFNKRALIVPRIKPRREQWIRAERFSALGLLDVLHPDELAPRRLSDWLAQAGSLPPPACDLVDLDGLARVVDLAAELVSEPAGIPDGGELATLPTWMVSSSTGFLQRGAAPEGQAL